MELPKSEFDDSKAYQDIIAQSAVKINAKAVKPKINKDDLITSVMGLYDGVYTRKVLGRKSMVVLRRMLTEATGETVAKTVNKPVFPKVTYGKNSIDIPVEEKGKEERKEEKKEEKKAEIPPVETEDIVTERGKFLFALNCLCADAIGEMTDKIAMCPVSMKTFGQTLREDNDRKEQFINLWGKYYLENRKSLAPFMGTLQMIILLNMDVASKAMIKKERVYIFGDDDEKEETNSFN